MAFTNINNPSDYFNTLTWTGADTSAGRDFTGVGFQPDLVWAKTRSDGNGHKWFDSVRGTGKSIQSESTGAETTNDGNGYIDSFDADGFSSVAGSTNNYNFNNTSTTFASWNWKAGGTAVSNTDGSITSSVSANQDAGFSIVSYSGSTNSTFTVGHGLSAVPKIFILKKRSSSGTNWVMYNANLGNDKRIQLNNTDASASTSGYGNTDPTSSVFTVANGSTTGADGETYIAYCFAEKKAFSKFGSYTGNGNADGTFVYTGFKPAFLLAKNSSTANRQWYIVDNKRSTSDGNNVLNKTLAPNQNNDENWWGTNNYVDFVSNGFKFRASYDGFNESGGTYIYMAFAENPFTTSTGIPTTAR
jgi:hypothetical protein